MTCAYRTARHDVTGYSPYFVNFGNEMVLKPDTEVPFEGEIQFDRSQDLVMKQNQLDKIREDVKIRLQRAYERTSKQYNLRKRSETFVVGQLVWRRNKVLSDAARGFTAKLAPKFVGPFIINKQVSPWVYELKDKDGVRCPGTWHARDLKPAYQNDDE